MPRQKVVRVEIEYADGEIARATGEDAEKIWQHVEGCEVMTAIHGGTYSGPTLKTVEKPR